MKFWAIWRGRGQRADGFERPIGGAERLRLIETEKIRERR
jgi:hypothetical protein